MASMLRAAFVASTGRPLWLGWVAAVAAASLVVVAQGAGPPGDAPPADGQHKRVLFDGQSLDGWKKADFFNAGEVKVEEGKIVMPTGRSMSGITSTRTDLPTTDYELSYEAMRIEGNDFFAAATFPVGKSFITLVNGGWGGNVTGLSSLDGMDASENETTRSVPYQANTWYRFRVRVTGKMIRCWLDGKEIVAVNHQDRRVAHADRDPAEPAAGLRDLGDRACLAEHRDPGADGR